MNLCNNNNNNTTTTTTTTTNINNIKHKMSTDDTMCYSKEDDKINHTKYNTNLEATWKNDAQQF